MPAGQRGPLSTRGTAAGGGGIFTETFSFCFRFHEIIPQSACGCQLPFQGSLFSAPFLPPLNLPPLKREGDRRRRWRDSTETFSFCFRFHEIIPQSAYGCQLSTRHALRVPFQGSLFTFFNDTQDIRRFVPLFFLQYTGTNHQNVCQFHHLKIG